MDASMDMQMVAAAQPAIMPAEPATTYERPFDVVCDMTLTRVEKIEILHRWLASVVTRNDAPRADQDDQVCAVTKALVFLGAPIQAP
jgi:hypothetical protein